MAGVDLVSVAAHPGYASTNLQTVGAKARGNRLGVELARLANGIVAQSAENGALPLVVCAPPPPDVHGGEYFGPGSVFHSRGHPTKIKPPRRSQRRGHRRTIVDGESESLTGIAFPLPEPLSR